ncbi:cysteine-rich venom protein pseudecin-like [Bactrocera neohumeralis]|uniref:cysteine-rich venom protein pseudecin-like n=1 Tax=Bactrocera neohumeralis TaxID=98809 RepID=UPI0021660888|nr:cysteine-rich venom protein pseudecin-like [Bactrocera neohumeralis]
MLLFVWFHIGLIEATSSIFSKTIPAVPCRKNITCGKEPHIMCESRPPQCEPFQPLKLGADEIYYFLLGHNGLRNRVAEQYNIANMNIVHWSAQLQMRAERFLRRCRVEPDACQNVGPKETRVYHNFHFHHGIIHQKWSAHLVRKWYNEFNYRERWENFNEKRKRGLIGNYSQLIYPTVELIGCNAANLSDGSLFVCYYWPRTSKKYEDGFLYGEPCSQCNPQLPACSRIFRGLCGIDLEISKAVSLQESVEKHVVLILVAVTAILRSLL